ncbi:MAG: ATP-dependent DNA helicase RecG [Candidatus Omnitrophica bacterium]|nr:ATP-dependent DNA helicase RecG [Candidatus Omnitrophota bacterium]
MTKTTDLSKISIQFIKGVGPARMKLFANLGIESVEDLLYFFPRRYEDRRNLCPIAQVKIGEFQTVCGIVESCIERRSFYNRKSVTEAVLDDGGGKVCCVWFNQPYLKSYFKKGTKVVCYGRADVYKNRIQMVAPEYEVIDPEEEQGPAFKSIVPIYSLTKGMGQRYIRNTVRICIDKYHEELVDELPVTLRNKYHLANIKRCITEIHFPQTFEEQEEALRRVSFEEFYFFQISVILRRLSIKSKSGIKQQISDSMALEFINNFPFLLTIAQKKAMRDIRIDMAGDHPMLRLVQGDVGSGKTLVALFGCYTAFKNGYQSCVMAPTEILARQHYDNILKLTDTGALKGLRVALLVNGLKKKERDDIYAKIADGQVDLVIGTHALICEELNFKNLSLVVIDEQHKFGVRQRALLSEKGKNPHVLIMTATPIPRTLCITLYGDLDLSIIDEMPPGRGKIHTVHKSHEEEQAVYEKVKSLLAKGTQAYFVYPIIEDSETVDLKAAEEKYQEFKNKVFKEWNVGLIHGKMKQADVEQTMIDFKSGKIHVLVATTVLEVGIDVPNANVMVIEHAERFGLAQLHQLRGRIGRGKQDALCVLVSDPTTPDGQKRLHAILSTTNGFKIAEEDLLIRGPGHFFGRHQHGLNELKVVNPLSQMDVLELARKEAFELTNQDPVLAKAENHRTKEIIKKRYPNYLLMVAAG